MSAKYRVSFLWSSSGLYSALVIAMLYALSCYIGQRYHGTPMYILHSANMKAMGGDGWVYLTSFGKSWPLDIVIYVLEKHNGHNCRKDSCGISFDGKVVQNSELSV